MKTEFTCHQCGEHKVHESEISTGYGVDKDKNKVCFACCGLNDSKTLAELRLGERFSLYWDGKNVINWPSTLVILPYQTRKGRHNIAGSRTDVWFHHRNGHFHGVQYGSNSQILCIKKIKP